MNKVLVTLLIYFRSYKNLKFKDFIEYSINSILRKIFNLYNFLKFAFVSSYTHKIHNVKINHLVDLNFYLGSARGKLDDLASSRFYRGPRLGPVFTYQNIIYPGPAPGPNIWRHVANART